MEHRAARAPAPVSLELVTTDEEASHLKVVDTTLSEQAPDPDLRQSVFNALQGDSVLTRGQLRERLAVKNERLGRILAELESQGTLERTAQGWRRTRSEA